MKRLYIFISIILLLNNITCFSQELEQQVSLEIDRLVVKNGQGFNYVWEWDEYEGSKWGLEQRSKKLPYESLGRIQYLTQEWWGWSNESITNEVLPDGSIKTTSHNPYVQTSLNLHPEYLYIEVKNTTQYYISVDLSSISMTISYPENDINRFDKKYEFSQIVFNELGSPYHYVIIPPYSSIKSGIVGNMHNFTTRNTSYKFISSEVLNDSRLDISLEMGIYRDNPIVRNKTFLDEYKIEYEYYSNRFAPNNVKIPYRGGCFENTYGSYYIYEDCISILGSPDLRIEEQIICKIKKTNKKLLTKKNKYGLKEYCDNVETTVSSKQTPQVDNELVRKDDEPRNLIGKSISDIRQVFPDLKYVRQESGKSVYEFMNLEFIFKNSTLVCETLCIRDGYSEYLQILKKLENTPYQQKSDENNNNLVRSIIYYYSDFSVIVSYWKSDNMIIYVTQSYDYFK